MQALSTATQSLARSPLARGVSLLAGLGAQVAAIVVLGPWTLALSLVPDVALLAGMSADANAEGRLAPRAVPLYNAVHALWGPLVVVAVGLLAGPLTLGLGLVWLSHVTVDRAAGYGLRNADGSQRG